MTLHISPASLPVSSLAEHALLANLSIRQWTARKYDPKASHRVTSEHAAAVNTARVNKRLLAKTALARVQACVSAARAEHDALTLPWGFRGLSILAMPGYQNYREVMAKHEAEFSAATYELARDYPQLRDDARRDLGELFSEADYPAAIADRFSFDVKYMPVPTGNDFRVNLPDRDLDVIRAQCEADLRQADIAAHREVYQRALEKLSTMADTLARYQPGSDGERAKGAFHGTLVTNVRELADTLPRLNLWRDPTIDALADRMRKIAATDAKDLKDSDALRADAERQAREAVADINAAMADYL